jgi:co-chaperonin GroES (HSP10)
MTFRPLSNAVVVRPIKEEKIGSIFIPECAQEEKPHWGTVLAAGPGRIAVKGPLKGQRQPLGVERGDKVYYRGGYWHRIDGEEVLIMPEEYIQAIEVCPDPQSLTTP